jgi:hypothetical protein
VGILALNRISCGKEKYERCIQEANFMGVAIRLPSIIQGLQQGYFLYSCFVADCVALQAANEVFSE